MWRWAEVLESLKPSYIWLFGYQLPIDKFLEEHLKNNNSISGIFLVVVQPKTKKCNIFLLVITLQSFEGSKPGDYLSTSAEVLPVSPDIPSLTETVSGTVLCRKHTPPTGRVQRGVSWSRFRNKTACSAAGRTTLNAILCCLSFSCSGILSSSHPSSPAEPGRWCARHSAGSLSALWLRIREGSARVPADSYMFFREHHPPEIQSHFGGRSPL